MRRLLFNRSFCSSADQQPQSGFTLIELLLIIVLLGVLAVAAINAFEGNEDQGRENITRLEMVQLQKALLQFRRDNRELPCMTYREGDFAPNTVNVFSEKNYEGYPDDYDLPASPETADAEAWATWCQQEFDDTNSVSASNALRMTNSFPYKVADFDFLLWEPVRQSGWNGPYISSEGLTDGWGNPYLLLDPELSYNQRYRCLLDGTDYAVVSDLYDCQPITALSDPTGYDLPADIVRIVSTGENGVLESPTSAYDLLTDDICAPPPSNPDSDDLILCLLR